MVKLIRINIFKIQFLAGNRLKVCVSASSQISMTLEIPLKSQMNKDVIELNHEHAKLAFNDYGAS